MSTDEVSKSEDTKEQNDRDKELASFETLEVRFCFFEELKSWSCSILFSDSIAESHDARSKNNHGTSNFTNDKTGCQYEKNAYNCESFRHDNNWIFESIESS